ncbi:glycosyltransferase [Streptococcus cristatus]|uniref:Glycosyl transferase family 2 n=1 Tax=Streptococcus cristatus TaxID=45634 RepID=A0A3R9SQI1_STRCR|nr:glycosyltransferase [Streptococcus cristatus]RSI42082.1 Glycosyl transferase family 2 [Streptococcus cristatus]RSJ82768.1 Glycosyl transferase family 2 [Streptococcus cristatus]
MSSIVLNMIVKNEAHIILETLQNLVNSITFDYWVISDTGSTDGTENLILNFFSEVGIPGELHKDEWQNFAYNRNLALNYARGKGDYILIFDADDFVEGSLKISTDLEADAYYLNFSDESGVLSFRRVALVKNNPEIYWRGVVHEFIELPEGASYGNLVGPYSVIARTRGARSLDDDKYYHDATVLANAVYNNQDPDLEPRYTFYCARSYRDAGLYQEALSWFKKRAVMTDGWSEEAYYSCLEIAQIYENEGKAFEGREYLEKAIQINPNRAEAWSQLAKLYREAGQHHIAFAYAYMAKDLELNPDSLFSWNRVYDYWIPFELLENGVKIGNFEVAYQGFRALIMAGQADTYKNYYEYLPQFEQYLDNEIIEKIIEVINGTEA